LKKIINKKETVVAAFYKFVDWDDFKGLKPSLAKVCSKAGTVGTILLAPEGINGTISGTAQGIQTVLEFLWNDQRLVGLTPKYSTATGKTFKRMKIKIKKEIVSMGKSEIKPAKATGTYIPPESWNNVISDPETVVIDVRNYYEHSVGTFTNSIQPNTKSFREFPEWVDQELKPMMKKKTKKIAMFCTGGIRCEKASSYLLQEGFKEVLQLQGGIQKYLQGVKPEESFWQGECFVFDDRVSLQHGLIEGDFDMCHACRMPIDENDKASKHYIEGVSCPHCYNLHSEERKERFVERQKQIELAKQREKASLAI
jgi:UPF0176 protein